MHSKVLSVMAISLMLNRNIRNNIRNVFNLLFFVNNLKYFYYYKQQQSTNEIILKNNKPLINKYIYIFSIYFDDIFT